MPDYTISITDNEKKCLDTVMVGIGTWAANLLENRAHHAQEKILSDLYKHCNENGIAIGVGVTIKSIKHTQSVLLILQYQLKN